MMFSIIVPLYNKAAYVSKAVYSILRQTYPQYEIIVVNDGSSDDSLKVVESIKKETDFNGVIINQENQGVAMARNNGVGYARGKYLCFLDADDWWSPSFLEEMKSLIERFPDAGIYGSKYYYVKDYRANQVNIGVAPSFAEGYIDYFRTYAKTLSMPLWTGAVVIPKSVFIDSGGFKPALKLGEDFDLWVRIALKYKVAFLNKSLSYYNQDVDLAYRAVKRLHNPQTHFLWNLDYLEEEECVNPDIKQLLDNLRVYDLFPYYLDKNLHDKAWQELKKVDWTLQPASWKRKYLKIPVSLLRIDYRFRRYGSKMKRYFISLQTIFKHPEVK